jgi:hypothetical protein
MKAKRSATATLADVRLVLSTPLKTPTRRRGYQKAEVDFLSARGAFTARATPMTWTRTVEAARRLHAEAKRVEQGFIEREREKAASRAATDEGGQG